VPDTKLEVIERSPYDDNLTLKINGQQEPVVLGPHVTGQIFVEPD
jgi:Fe2+ transport system protein FeoA